MKAWGYGSGYQHAHDFEDAVTHMECLPPGLAGRTLYQPTTRGVEARIAERIDKLRQARQSKPPEPI
jgi:putative ATPase